MGILENPGPDADIGPIWPLCLFAGSFVGSIILAAYLFNS